MYPNDTNTAQSFDSFRLSHAYIASGELADRLTMAVVCPGNGGKKPCMSCAHCDKARRRIHPDITYVDVLPDKREIVVDQIRELKKDVISVPNDSEKKAYVIDSADLMNRNAQNAFLQMLEEPPAHAVFILRTGNPAALLPTVRSRCVELRAWAETETPNTSALEMADEFLSAIEMGSAALASFMFRLEKLDKDTFAGFLPAARSKVAAKLRENGSVDTDTVRKTMARAGSLLIKAGEMLDLNVNTGHISGMICADLIRAAERAQR